MIWQVTVIALMLLGCESIKPTFKSFIAEYFINLVKTNFKNLIYEYQNYIK